MIQKFFDVSTVHMPYSMAYKDSSVNDYLIANYDEGFFAWIPGGEELDELPEWFRDICELAIQDDCHRIRVDADGEVYDELKLYDW